MPGPLDPLESSIFGTNLGGSLLNFNSPSGGGNMAERKFMYLDPNEGFVVEAPLTESLSTGGLNVNSGKIINLATPELGTDAVNKNYADALRQGIYYKTAVRAASTANIASLADEITVDGVALVAGDRVLVKGQTTGSQNGIYVVVSGGAWTRASDMAASSHAGASLVWVNEGTANAVTAWYCETVAPTDIVGTDATVWINTHTVSPATLDGDGLSRTGQTLNVVGGAGLDVDSTSVFVDLATTSGLEFDAVGAAGKLQAKINADGGLERASAGLGIKLDGTTLALSSSGAAVAGLPSLFTVNGTAVSANVTATNLDTLTGGSNADSLHSHAASAATEAPLVKVPAGTAGAALSKGDPVYFSGNDTANKAEAGTAAKARVVGLSSAAFSSSAAVTVVTQGVLTGVLSSATAGTPYYLGDTGGLVLYAAISSASRVVRVGYAINASDLFLAIEDIGKKA
jgi:hypothetical protein